MNLEPVANPFCRFQDCRSRFRTLILSNEKLSFSLEAVLKKKKKTQQKKRHKKKTKHTHTIIVPLPETGKQYLQ